MSRIPNLMLIAQSGSFGNSLQSGAPCLKEGMSSFSARTPALIVSLLLIDQLSCTQTE